MYGPGSAKSATEFIPKYPHDMGARMLIVTAFTFNGASNMNDSTYATSALALGCQHWASSKLAPSLLVNIFTSPGL